MYVCIALFPHRQQRSVITKTMQQVTTSKPIPYFQSLSDPQVFTNESKTNQEREKLCPYQLT